MTTYRGRNTTLYANALAMSFAPATCQVLVKQEQLKNECWTYCTNATQFALWDEARQRHGADWQWVRSWLVAGHIHVPPDPLLRLGPVVVQSLCESLASNVAELSVADVQADLERLVRRYVEPEPLDGSATVEEWDPDFDPRSTLITDL